LSASTIYRCDACGATYKDKKQAVACASLPIIPEGTKYLVSVTGVHSLYRLLKDDPMRVYENGEPRPQGLCARRVTLIAHRAFPADYRRGRTSFPVNLTRAAMLKQNEGRHDAMRPAVPADLNELSRRHKFDVEEKEREAATLATRGRVLARLKEKGLS
jgi:hypothetical protein